MIVSPLRARGTWGGDESKSPGEIMKSKNTPGEIMKDKIHQER
jgi:hypothetical protein